MIILAIETSCDETAVALIRQDEKTHTNSILASKIASSLELHKKTGGIVPEVAAREQLISIVPLLKETMDEANLHKDHIDEIAVTYGPGLVGSLLVGVETAKTLALAWKKPLKAINHLKAHLLINWLNTDNQPKLPSLGLVISGGHTDLVKIEALDDITWIGGTRDDAAGECFDKCARIIFDEGYPGGPIISTMAKKADNTSEKRLPRPMLHSPNLEMSFSGLKTAVFNTIKAEKALTPQKKYNLAYDLEQSIIEVVIKKLDTAINLYSFASLVVGGGVVANTPLRLALDALAQKHKIRVFYPTTRQSSDNAEMIGAAALLQKNLINPLTLWANPSLTVEEV